MLERFRHHKLDYSAEAYVICSEGMLHLRILSGLGVVDMCRTRDIDWKHYTEGSSESTAPFSLCMNDTPSLSSIICISTHP